MNFSTEVLSRASTRLAGLRADHESRYHSRRAAAYDGNIGCFSMFAGQS